MSWTHIGGPGKTFAAGSKLYGLSPDGGGVYQYDGTPMHWTKVGGPAAAIYAYEAQLLAGKESHLYATNPSSGDIYEYNGTPMSWTRIGGPGKMFAPGLVLFGLSPDGSAVYQYDGTPMHWTKVGGPAAAIFAGSMGLCATDPNTHDLWQYS